MTLRFLPGFGIALHESGLVHRPHLDIGQHVDQAEIPEADKSLSAHLELHRLQGGRAQDSPVSLLIFLVSYPCNCCYNAFIITDAGTGAWHNNPK